MTRWRWSRSTNPLFGRGNWYITLLLHPCSFALVVIGKRACGLGGSGNGGRNLKSGVCAGIGVKCRDGNNYPRLRDPAP